MIRKLHATLDRRERTLAPEDNEARERLADLRESYSSEWLERVAENERLLASRERANAPARR